MTSHTLLERIFAQLGADTTHMGASDTATVEAFVEALPSLIHKKVDIVFNDIFTLACKDGLAMIDKIAKARRKKDWQKPFLHLYGIDASPYSKAAWLWLEYPDLFGSALEALAFSRLSWSHVRTHLKKTVPVFSPDIREKFEAALCEERPEGLSRFSFCESIMKEYGDGIYYFSVYLSDYVHSGNYLGDSHVDVLTKECLFHFVFAYDSHAGTLRLHAPKSPTTKEHLEDLFIRQVLHQKPSSERIVVCDLTPLKYKTANLGYYPEDAIRISVVEAVLAGDEMRVLFHIRHFQDNLRIVAKEYLNLSRLRNSDVVLVKCNIHFEFLPGASCREGSCTIELRQGGSIDLRHQDNDRAKLIHKYFKKLGLEHVSLPCSDSR